MKNKSHNNKRISLKVGEKSIQKIAAKNGNSESKEIITKPVRNKNYVRLSRFKKYINYYIQHLKWTGPVTLIIILLIVFLVPYSRYKILGSFIKEDVNISVIDSSTNLPVSNAHIQVGTLAITTSDEGKAHMNIPVGGTKFDVYKQYYRDQTENLTVSFDKSKNLILVRLAAIGREVPITVVNKITNQPIAGAVVKVLYSSAKTDKNGKVTIVLPVNKSVQKGTLNLNGYNDSTIVVQVTSQDVPANTFSITPTGKLYFLSNLSGKIDVVKTNLDGTGRQTVLAGTGNEDPTSTVLLASRDWKYLALYAQRSTTGHPEIDLIDTSNDSESNIDEGNASFSVVGWDGDYFIYNVNRNNIPSCQSGREVLKSFDAQTKTIKALAQSTAVTTGWTCQEQDLGGYGGTYIINNQVVFTLSNPVQNVIYSINPDGSKGSEIKNSTGYFEITSYDEPNTLAILEQNYGNYNYYEFQNGKVSTSNDLTEADFYRNKIYPTFLESPSGNHTFWAEPTDGKNNLFVGDQNGNNSKKIAILSDYSPYGWFTDTYLLVSKNSSELYILPVTGGTPIPISDYFKPTQFYLPSYGGGYGAL